jgi:hypothetical protein
MVDAILAERAAGPRIYCNMLVFVATDKARLEELRAAARWYLDPLNQLTAKRVYGSKSPSGVRRTVERPGAEVLNDRIEALRQPRDLALRRPLDAKLLHQLLHPPRRDAGQIRV